MPLSDVASYPLWLNVSIFAAAAIIVWIAGTWLTRNVDAIAARIKMGAAFAGMLLLGGITSLPEAANVITSSATGNPELGINNVVGSAAINVLLLALADACIGRRAVTGIVAHPSTMMMATLCMLVLTVMAGAVTLGDIQVIGVGVGGATVCAISVGFFWLATGYASARLGGSPVGKRAPPRREGTNIPTSLWPSSRARSAGPRAKRRHGRPHDGDWRHDRPG